MRLRFSRREVRDLLVAWLALGVAFAVFFERDLVRDLVQSPSTVDPLALGLALAISLVTAGFGFLLHELAHKVVAVRFGQIAGFRADYGMLLLAIFGAFVGFLFAAPGAVYHRGRISKREGGLIALAGPLTNLGLGIVFVGLLLAVDPQFLFDFLFASDPRPRSLLAVVAFQGLLINALLAGFNMIPFGPLDGRTVLDWNTAVFALAFVVTVGPAIVVLFPQVLRFVPIILGH